MGCVRINVHHHEFYIERNLLSKVENWRSKWLYMEYAFSRQCLRFPHELLKPVPSYWEAVEPEDPRLELVFCRISLLRQSGLEGGHVVYDLLVNRLAPVHHRPRPS